LPPFFSGDFMGVTLQPNRLQRSEHFYAQYAVELPGHVSLDDAMTPEYLAHVASRLRQFDRICFMAEDGSYLADTVVVSARPGAAVVKLLQKVDLTDGGDVSAEPVGLVKVEWRGPRGKWTIIRVSDAHVIKNGIASEADARREAAEYERSYAG
jgi:hypothetical protein